MAKKLNRWFTAVKDGRRECWLTVISAAEGAGTVRPGRDSRVLIRKPR